MIKEQEPEQPQFAGFFVRIFASLIDIFITTPILVLLFYLLGFDQYQRFETITANSYFSQSQVLAKGNPIIDLISWTLLIIYSVYFLCSKKQATLGKRIMNIYVARPDGSRVGHIRAIARFFASILSLSLLGIGVLMIAFTKEKTGLHDLICDTRVFYGKK